MKQLISPAVVQQADRFAREFRAASPFPHVVIDEFLDRECCEHLLAEFPRFESKYAANELGELGGKAVRVDVRELSETYRRLDTYIRGSDFLGPMSKITGIPSLLYDPQYVGGGTHENVHGQGLYPHVDFNYHPSTTWHRRLNLLLYLNQEWEAEWGGALELQSNPWDGSQSEKKTVLPVFNRCVIFATSERSWHGFKEIQLPANRRQLTRKSFALYLYTRERPADETAASHATVYVPDARPDELIAGTKLTAAHIKELDRRFANLHRQLRFLYDREKEFNEQIARLERSLREARAALHVDLQGYAVQPSGATGIWPDGWVGSEARFSFIPSLPVHSLELQAWVPGRLGGGQQLSITAGLSGIDASIRSGQTRTITLPVAAEPGESVEVHITASFAWRPCETGDGQDERALSFKLLSLKLRHSGSHAS